MWIGDSGATSRRAVLISCTTQGPPSLTDLELLGDGSIKKVQFVGKLDLVFHSRTDYPVIFHGVSFVPDLGFNLFSFHVVQEKTCDHPEQDRSPLAGWSPRVPS